MVVAVASKYQQLNYTTLWRRKAGGGVHTPQPCWLLSQR
jgi:hypothetical protein